MLVNAICRYLASIVLMLLGFWLCTGQVFSNVSGGPGKPITPYGTNGISLDTENITRLKEYAAKTKYISYMPVSGGNDIIQIIEEIGIAYRKSDRIEGTVHFAFLGTDENGNKLEVDFSEVDDFEVLGKEGDLLVLEINLFPAITPEELLRKSPNYLELRERYRKSVTIRLQPRTENGAMLYLVGKSGSDDQQPIVPIEKIELGSKIPLRYRRGDPKVFWWAIPSVSSDPAYPHRIQFKR